MSGGIVWRPSRFRHCREQDRGHMRHTPRGCRGRVTVGEPRIIGQMKPRDMLTLIALAAVWGASFLFLRVAAPVVGPVGVAAARVSLAAVLLGLALLATRQAVPSRRSWPDLMVSALLSCVLPALCLGQAALSLPAGMMSILNATTPLWGVMVGWIWSRQAPSRVVVGGMLAGLLGVGILTGPGHIAYTPTSAGGSGVGPVLLILVATLSYAISVHHARRRLQHLSPLALCAGTMVLASACLLGPAWFIGPAGLPSGHWSDVPAAAWGAMFALGAVCTALAYTVFFQLIQRLGPTPALTVTFLIPVFGMLWGALFLSETITPPMLLGTAIIAWGTWQSARAPASPPAVHQVT